MTAATATLVSVARGVGALHFADLGVWGGALGWLVGDALGVRRSHVVASMRKAGISHPEEAASAMYRSLGTSALELLWLAGRPRSLAECTRIDPESSGEIERARARGRGIVFAASHTGNWDLAACAIAQRMPLMVVTKRLSMRWVDAFWQSSRAAYGVTLVEASGAMARARAHLASNGAVAMMIDQVPVSEKHAVVAPFLGQDALVDRAPFALAASAGAPVLVSAARRTPGGQQLSVIATFAPPDKPGPRWVRGAAREATRALDAFVTTHPSEWLWMHRRWKRPT